MSLLIILMTLAAPSFQRQIASSRLSAAANDLQSALARARSEAIRRGSRVSVCASSDGVSCSTASTPEWNAGWLVFVDPTRAGSNASVDGGEEVLQRGQPTAANVLIRGGGDTVKYASFSADGRSKLMSGATQIGVWRVCSTSAALSDDERARDLCLSPTGRVTMQRPSGVSAVCEAPAVGGCE